MVAAGLPVVFSRIAATTAGYAACSARVSAACSPGRPRRGTEAQPCEAGELTLREVLQGATSTLRAVSRLLRQQPLDCPRFGVAAVCSPVVSTLPLGTYRARPRHAPCRIASVVVTGDAFLAPPNASLVIPL